MRNRLFVPTLVLQVALLSGPLAGNELQQPTVSEILPSRSETWSSGGGGDDDGAANETPVVFAEFFETDPLSAAGTVVAGEALTRLSWQPDAPAFPGDVPGSLQAVYDSRLAAGWFGWLLPRAFDANDTFSAAAAFVIRSEGYAADPDGFFQISWGLWNSTVTGLNRTGSFQNFATDTYELIEFDYFPNVSPFFGGPFISPSIFGAEVGQDGFANFTTVFDLDVALPLDVPLLVVIEHRPGLDALVLGVHRIVDSAHVLPLNGAVGVAPLDGLSLREYDVDTIGLTLWHDGFGDRFPQRIAMM